MTRTRWVAAIALVALLAALQLWQYRREGAIADCLADGGSWTGGLRAACIPARPIILQRELQRS